MPHRQTPVHIEDLLYLEIDMTLWDEALLFSFIPPALAFVLEIAIGIGK